MPKPAPFHGLKVDVTWWKICRHAMKNTVASRATERTEETLGEIIKCNVSGHLE